jgi:hypothetical protein
MSGGHDRRLTVDAAFGEDCPGDAGHLVGQGDGGVSRLFAGDQRGQPCSFLGFLPPQGTGGANHQQGSIPALVIGPRIVLPPEEFCDGTNPSQAAKSRPVLKRPGSPMVATMALAVSGPPRADRHREVHPGQQPPAAPVRPDLLARRCRTRQNVLATYWRALFSG